MSSFVLITGVTRGLGKALVHQFIKTGHIIAGCGRSIEKIRELQKEFISPHSFIALDIRDDQAVKEWAQTLLASQGPPSLLINNAAITANPAPLWKISVNEFDSVIDTNIKGVANILRHFLPAMIHQKSGIIVNLSSGWGRSVDAYVAPYCTTKWAIEGLTKTLAEELPDGMAAIPLNPGVIDTDMLQQCWGNDANQYPTPQQWATRAVPFLLQLTAKENGKSLSVPTF